MAYEFKPVKTMPARKQGSSGIGALATETLAFFTENAEASIVETSAKRMGRKTRAVLAENGLGAENRNGHVFVYRVESK